MNSPSPTSPPLLHDPGPHSPPAPHLIILGDARVGKSTLIDVLQGFATRKGVELMILEGRSSDLPACAAALSSSQCHSLVPLVVWDADNPMPLVDYVTHHLNELVSAIGERPNAPTGGDPCASPKASRAARLTRQLQNRLLVFCNKTDELPCPLPQLAALDPSTIFLAGSALRGTNMRELWRLVETCAAPRLRGLPTSRSKPLAAFKGFVLDEGSLAQANTAHSRCDISLPVPVPA